MHPPPNKCSIIIHEASINVLYFFAATSGAQVLIDFDQYCREFANTIPRSFVARYDPYTQRIEHLDSKRQVLKNMRQVRREMGILTDAMEKLS